MDTLIPFTVAEQKLVDPLSERQGKLGLFQLAARKSQPNASPKTWPDAPRFIGPSAEHNS